MPPQTPNTICLPCILLPSLTTSRYCRYVTLPTHYIRITYEETTDHIIAKGPKRTASGQNAGCGARGEWQRPIVPQGCPCSIVGAGGLNDRVRDEHGSVRSAIVTSPTAYTDVARRKRDERAACFALRVSVLRCYCAQEGRRRPIVPQGCPCSIVGAGGLNDRVR